MEEVSLYEMKVKESGHSSDQEERGQEEEGLPSQGPGHLQASSKEQSCWRDTKTHHCKQSLLLYSFAKTSPENSVLGSTQGQLHISN